MDIPVSSNIIELDMSIDDPFYKGKGIVAVESWKRTIKKCRKAQIFTGYC
ncbi:MAG: hypothetical protein HRT44_06125 [Bdellovibrionales bacterium]|nr:hypothetical protein [Bdellovibrionales bacterium]